MAAATKSVTLSPAEIDDLSKKLSILRHNINNHLSLVIAAAELIRLKPETAPRMTETLLDQPQKISQELRAFSAEFNTKFELEAKTPPADASSESVGS
jgi:hypothetical protein